ncbi:tight junction-associated protein 1 isoform 2-T2 [Theristicus caerulescens]
MGQRSGKRCPNRSHGHLSKFVSRSMETVVVSGDERHHPTCSLKSRSLERSLMFKEPPEVLTPRKFRVSSTHLPLKGILKQTNMTGPCPESLRKSRSVETLSRGRGSWKYSDPQLCLSRSEKHSLDHSSSSAADSVKRREKITEEKLQFSKFLDEITQRVLSPIRLRSVGETRGAEQDQNSPLFRRSSVPEDQREGHLEGVKTKRATERSPCPSRRKAEKKCEGLGMASCQRKCTEEAERASKLRKKPIHGRKDSKEKLSLERRVVDLCQYELQQLADLGLAGTSSGQQHSLSSWKSSAEGRRDESIPCSQLLQPHHLCAKLGQKRAVEPNYPEKGSFSTPTRWSREEGPTPSRSSPSFSLALSKEPLTDAERMKLLQHENEELRRRLTYVTNKMEAMERELESGQDYLEMELGQNREELEKFKDKFRRLQNSYTASQRTNQDLEEKLHALIKKAEMDRKTLDWEIVELTNKLLDAKTTINKLEELNERYRQDCNLAVQLLKCNKSHFRNHKFADLPYELQDMVNKHLHNTQESAGPGQEATHTLAPSDVVPTSVIARVLEKPESLVLNSAKSSSGSCPMAEDVFVHVDMSGAPPDACNSAAQMGKEGDAGKQQNGGCKPQSSVESVPEEVPAFEKLSPYPTPSPPHPMYPGRKVIEFSEDKVRIPKNSPLPNCTYATRQAISLSLVQSEDESCDRHRTLPNSPASEGRRSASSCSCQQSPKAARAHGSSQSSPFSSPPQIPSAFASSASSEEDLLANWQRMFVDKAPPTSERVLMNRTAFSRDMAPELQKRFSCSMQELGRAASAYSDGEESAQSCSWTVSRDSSMDTDSTESRARRSHFSSDYGTDFSQDEAQKLLQESGGGTAEPGSPSPEKHKDYVDLGLPESPAEEREMLLQGSKESNQGGAQEESGEGRVKPPFGRPHRSPKRMGVHHLHRKDSLTQAQEQGNLLS